MNTFAGNQKNDQGPFFIVSQKTQFKVSILTFFYGTCDLCYIQFTPANDFTNKSDEPI